MPKHSTFYEQSATPAGALPGALWRDTDTSVVQILTVAGWQEFGGAGGGSVMAAQDPSGDWWTFDVDNDGILVTENIGPAPPTGGDVVISAVPMTQAPDGNWWVQSTDNTGRITTTNVGAVPTTGTPPFASVADLAKVKNSIDLSIRDYTGLDTGGATDMSTLLNQISVDARAVAVAGGYPYVTLGGFGRGVYRIDQPLQIRDRVRFRLDGARIVAGAAFTTPGATSGMFRATETLRAAVAQGTGTTASGSFIITAVSSAVSWRTEDRITGTGIPANAKVVAVDALNGALVIDAAASASGTVTLTKAATYYGNYRNAGVIGGELDPNGFQVGAVIRAMWTEDFVFEGTRLLHNRGSTTADWATVLGGHRMRVDGIQIVGGTRVFEDGFHFLHGQHLKATNLEIESGDDMIAIGGETADTTLAATPDPIRHVTIRGVSGRSHRGLCPKIYVPAGGTGRDWEISDVEISGVVGESGVLRNGGIWVEDLNGTVAGTTQIRRVHLNGFKLKLGSRGHSDVQPVAITINSCSDVTIENYRVTIQEGEAASGGSDFALIRRSEDITLDNVGCPLLGRRHSVHVTDSNRVRVENSKFVMNSVTPFSQTPFRLNNAVDFKAIGNEITNLRAGGAMAQITEGTTNSATFIRNTPKVWGASTGYGFNLTAAAVVRLTVVENDFSDLDGDFQNLTTLRSVPIFEVRDNIGYPDRNMASTEPYWFRVMDVRRALLAVAAASTPLVMSESEGGVPGGANGSFGVFMWDPADVGQPGQTVRWRHKVSVITNATDPGSAYTVDVRPFTASAGGAAGVVAVTLGAAVTGSTVSIANPGANAEPTPSSVELDAPAAGQYAIVVTLTPDMAASSAITVRSQLKAKAI